MSSLELIRRNPPSAPFRLERRSLWRVTYGVYNNGIRTEPPEISAVALVHLVALRMVFRAYKLRGYAWRQGADDGNGGSVVLTETSDGVSTIWRVSREDYIHHPDGVGGDQVAYRLDSISHDDPTQPPRHLQLFTNDYQVARAAMLEQWPRTPAQNVHRTEGEVWAATAAQAMKNLDGERWAGRTEDGELNEARIVPRPIAGSSIFGKPRGPGTPA